MEDQQGSVSHARNAINSSSSIRWCSAVMIYDPKETYI